MRTWWKKTNKQQIAALTLTLVMVAAETESCDSGTTPRKDTQTVYEKPTPKKRGTPAVECKKWSRDHPGKCLKWRD